MTKKPLLKKILLTFVLITASVGISYVFADYNNAPANPPSANTEQPLHVEGDQEKKGPLSVGSFIANKSALFNGQVNFFGGLYGVGANDTVSTDQPTQIRFGGTYLNAESKSITEKVSLQAKGDIVTKKDFTADSLKNPAVVNPKIITLRPVCSDNFGELVICPDNVSTPTTPTPSPSITVPPPTVTDADECYATFSIPPAAIDQLNAIRNTAAYNPDTVYADLYLYSGWVKNPSSTSGMSEPAFNFGCKVKLTYADVLAGKKQVDGSPSSIDRTGLSGAYFKSKQGNTIYCALRASTTVLFDSSISTCTAAGN